MSSLVWFRRDLRVHDHSALTVAMREGTTFALFVFDPRLTGARTTGPRRLRFLVESLAKLGERLEMLGVPLLIREGPPEYWVPEVARSLGVRRVHVTMDVTPYSRTRDARVERALAAVGGKLVRHGGLLLAPTELIESAGVPKSFSAFYRHARSRSLGTPLPPPPKQTSPSIGPDPVPTARRFGADVTLPAELAPGEVAARARLAEFARARLGAYAEARNCLDVRATSQLSQDLHFGLLSPREVALYCPSEPFLRQLHWRDYAHAVIYSRPTLTRQAARPELEQLPWRRDRETFERWAHGQTGFPLVDAAMRELASTGRLANRLRMLVASFLAKQLLIDWRWGMEHFMRQLVDADVANNTFGWQWAASLGVDAASPFRIFSAQRHFERFDPDGKYVRQWVPEITAELSQNVAPAACVTPRYAAPIVDEFESMQRARELWRVAAKSG